MKKNKTFSYLYVIIAYVIAIYGGWICLEFIQTGSPLIDMLIADVLVTVIIFIFSIMAQNSSLYDPYWSVLPVPIALYWMYIFPDGNHFRQILMLIAISVWSIRLTINWIRSWPDLSHEDWRYKKLAEDSGSFYWVVSFLGIHLFPTLIVFAGLLPVYVASQEAEPVGLFDIIGIIICLSAAVIEYVADEQLRKFKSTNTAEGANMADGLWAFSRHPNYFGEILFWLGLLFFSVGHRFLEHIWTAAGFIFMFVLFRYISIPMMEKRLAETRTGYVEYQKKVQMIFPLKV